MRKITQTYSSFTVNQTKNQNEEIDSKFEIILV